MKVDISDLEQYEQMYIDALKAIKTESTVSIIFQTWINTLFHLNLPI